MRGCRVTGTKGLLGGKGSLLSKGCGVLWIEDCEGQTDFGAKGYDGGWRKIVGKDSPSVSGTTLRVGCSEGQRRTHWGIKGMVRGQRR